MAKFLSLISDIRVVIGIAVVVVILTVWLIIEKVRTKKFRNELVELEKRYADIKAIPLTFKMNKAVTAARSNVETAEKVNGAKKSYDQTQASIKKISENLANCEDAILLGKLRKADSIMTELESDLSLTNKEATDLDAYLDEILAKETAQRQEVTTLKNRFRALKSMANENSGKLSYNYNVIEEKIANTEKMFSTFEDWMYSSDYDRANKELEQIQESMAELEGMLDNMPTLLQDARGVVPNMLEECAKDYKKAASKGVYLKHLDVENNLKLLSDGLNDDLKKLKEGDSTDVSTNLDDYKNRIEQLSNSIHSEVSAHNQMKSLTQETEDLFEETNADARFVTSEIENNAEKYEDDMRKAYEYIKSLDGLMKESPINMQLLNSTLQEALDFIYKLYNEVNNVVGTVVMVENTIVFGNRYRSTYADIDSALTRSELSFRNGEYTKALTTAIATIEKIHPGNYESMIKENSKGA